MTSYDELQPLWEQAVADENWALVADYEEQRRTMPDTAAPASTESSGVQEQRAILSAELHWFGGIANHGRTQIGGPRDIM